LKIRRDKNEKVRKQRTRTSKWRRRTSHSFCKKNEDGRVECEIYFTGFNGGFEEDLEQRDMDILKSVGLNETEAENAIDKLQRKTICCRRVDASRLLTLNWNPPGTCQLHPDTWEWDHGRLWF